MATQTKKTLTKLRLINWHYFENETISLKSTNLFSGENGAGKSTILDAIQLILTTNSRKFNQAANTDSKRSLKTYVRGKTGEEGNEYLRKGPVISYIALEVFEESKQKYFVLGAKFDSPDLESDVKRKWFCEESKLEDLTFITDNKPSRDDQFLSRGKKVTFIQQTTIAKDRFKHRLGHLQDNFFELLSKSLAFKPMKDVKSFVSQFILPEKTIDIADLRENIRNLKEMQLLVEEVKKQVIPTASIKALRRNSPMTNYKKAILDHLLDKYERSKSFTGDNKKEQRFTVKLNKLYPAYDDETAYDLLKSLDEAVAELEELDYVAAKRLKNGMIDSVCLNIQHINDVYAYIGRTPKAQIHEQLVQLLDQYTGRNALLTRFCDAQKSRLLQNKKAEYFDGDLVEYERLLKAVSMVFDIEDETFIRDFSIKVFGDSKVFGTIQGKVRRLLFQYGDFPEEESMLEELNIVRNPGHVYMKGNAVISINGQTIDLSRMKGDIALSSALLPDIDSIRVTGQRIVTIENLTSFHAFHEKDTFAVYLGGYHNTHRRNFIMQMYQHNPDATYYHFGDIDAGGFYILLHLREKTGVAFEPYHMGVAEMQQYAAYTKTLTENDVKRLRCLLDSEFADVVRYMLDNNCKLEQEAMDLR